MNKIKPLTQAGLFSSLHIVLLIISNAIIGVDFILIIGLPFASALYSLKNKPLHAFLFALATTLICFPIDIIKTLIYIIPSLVSGITYGYLTKLKFSNLTLIYCLTFISSLLFVFSIFIINVIYTINFIDIDKSFFNLGEETFNNYGPSLVLIIGFCQSILTHIIITKESIVASPALLNIKRKGVMSNDYKKYKTVLFITCTPNRNEEKGDIKRC